VEVIPFIFRVVSKVSVEATFFIFRVQVMAMKALLDHTY
jgi:hypothetical protein